MGDPLFYMGCGEYSKGPKVIAKVCIDKHSSGHAAYGQVCTFHNTILGRGIEDCFLIHDILCFTVRLHLTLDQFRGVVDPENLDSLPGEVFDSSLKLGEE